jgi:hypothetical protein
VEASLRSTGVDPVHFLILIQRMEVFFHLGDLVLEVEQNAVVYTTAGRPVPGLFLFALPPHGSHECVDPQDGTIQ